MAQTSLGADMKAGMVNIKRAGKANYDTTQLRPMIGDKQVRTVPKDRVLRVNPTFKATTGLTRYKGKK